MNRLARFIKELPYEDLLLIKKDLEKGNIDRVLKEEINDREHNRISICPVCSTPVKQGEGYHIQFGPKGLRKKATFDGADCLNYFMSTRKK